MPTPYQNPVDAQNQLTSSLQPTTPEQAQAISQASAQVPTINSASLASSPSVTFASPTPTPIASAPSVPELQATQPEKQANDASSLLQSLNDQLRGQSAYRTTQENAQGIPELQKTQTDLSARLKLLQADALNIPNQAQLEAHGQGITAGGLAPHTNAALRMNSIQANTVGALLAGSQGQITYANSLVDRAVNQKFDPIKEEIDATTKNLQLIINSPAYSLADKNRAQAQLDAQHQRDAQWETQKANAKEVLTTATTAASYGADSATVQAIQNAPDAATAMQIASKAGFARDPMVLQKFQADMANTKFNQNLETQKLAEDKRQFNQTLAFNKDKAAATGTTTGGTTTGGTTNGGVSKALTDAINNGTIDPNRLNSRTLPIYNAIAQAGTDAVGAHAGAAGETKAVQDLTTYKSTATKTLGVIEKNVPLLVNLADKVNQTGVPGLDQYLQGVKSYTGNNQDVIKYVNSLKVLRSEYAQMLSKGAVATEGDKKDAAEAIPAGLSGAGYQALANQLKLEATNIISSSDDAIRAAKDKSSSNTGSASTQSSTSYTSPAGNHSVLPFSN